MDDTQQSRASDAAATRKRRSSILKSQRPPRTPFSELEFNVATPTDTAKSRRVSFSRRTGVAEFVTNEATTTWKNFYEEHNKSLESSGNESAANPPRPPIGHIGKRIFDQQFQEVEAVDLVTTLDNHSSRNINTSMNNVNFTQQLASLECTGDDKLAMPLQNFEMSAFTDHQSRLFGDDLAAPIMGEASGRIDINFSAIQTIGEVKDDLDEIQKDLEKAANNVVCPGPFTGRKSLSEYIEVDLNATHISIKNDEDDMSITDTISSPKVQDVSKNCSSLQVDKKSSFSKDWVADKENIALNPYVAPKESKTFAVNDESDKILVFDGKRLTVSSDREADMILKNSRDSIKPLVPKESIPHQRKTIVLNVNDDLPNFVNDPMSTSVGFINHMPMDQSNLDTSLVSDIGERNKTLIAETDMCEISMTNAVPTNIILPKSTSTEKRRTIVFEDGNISMTQALPANIFVPEKTNACEEHNTIVYESNTADISVTKAVPSNIILPKSTSNEKRKTIVFEEDLGNLSMTQALPANIIVPENTNICDKHETILYESSMGDISVTKAIPSNIIMPKSSNEKRNTIVFQDDAGNLSITQALPANFFATVKPDACDNPKDFAPETSAADLSVTSALPSNIIMPNEKRKTIVFEEDGGNLSITQALSANIFASVNAEITERNKTILNESNAADMSATTAIPTNIILPESSSNEKRKTIVFEDGAGNISITQALPANIFSAEQIETAVKKHTENKSDSAEALATSIVTNNIILTTSPSKEKRKTLVFDDEAGNLSITQTLPANIFASEKMETEKHNIEHENNAADNVPNTIPISIVLPTGVSDEKSKTIVVGDETANLAITKALLANFINLDKTKTSEKLNSENKTNAGDLSVTNAVPNNIVLPKISSDEKRKTIVFGSGNISITQTLPAKIFVPESETNKTFVHESKTPDLSVTQAVLVNVLIVNNATEKIQSMLCDSSGQNDLTDKTNKENTDSESVFQASDMIDIKQTAADTTIAEKDKTLQDADDVIRINNDLPESMSDTEATPACNITEKTETNDVENSRSITSSDNLIYIIRDTEGETQTETDDKPNKSLKWKDEVPKLKHSPLSIEYDEEVDKEITVDLPKKLSELKDAVNKNKSPTNNRVFEKVISSDLENNTTKVGSEEMDVSRAAKSFKDANDTKELLEMLSDLTDRRPSREPEIEVNEPKRLSLAPNRLSIVLSREDLLNNISMAQAALQRSIEIDESLDTTTDTPVEIDMPSKKATRVSNEVVKKLHFEDESASDASIKSELRGSALKKTAFGETSYMKEGNKAKVIPGFLKEVSDDMKALMNDLVKPNADTLLFKPTEKSLKREASTCSTQIQANLLTSSQIDLDVELTSVAESDRQSLYDLDKVSIPTSDRSHSQRSSLKHGEEKCYEMPPQISFRPRRLCESPPTAPVQERVIVFDHNNPLNNICLSPMDFSDVHRYNPPKSNDTLPVESESFRSSKDSGEQINTQFVGNVTVTRTMHPSGDSVPDKSDAQSLLSNTSKRASIDESVSVRVCELKDTKVNTLIAMKANKDLLEASSSLTLVDDALARSTFDVPIDIEMETAPSSVSFNAKPNSPVKVIFHNEDQKATQKLDSDFTSNDEISESFKNTTKGKKRIYSPTKRDKHKTGTVSAVDVTPKPTTKMQKLSTSPVYRAPETDTSPIPAVPDMLKELPEKLTAEKDDAFRSKQTDLESSDGKEFEQPKEKKRSPRKSKSPKAKKPGTNVTVQQLITQYDINPGIDQDALNKQIIKALSGSDSSTAPLSVTDVHNADIKSPDIVSSFTSSKNQNDMQEACSAAASEAGTRTTSSRSRSMKMDWQPEMSETSTNMISECESSVNVVAKIDMLPFMGSHECEWEASGVDTWSFRLLHARLRLSARLAHRHDNATRTRVRADTPVLAVVLEVAHKDKKNTVASLCVKFAAEAMRYFIGRGCERAGAVPALLRRCAAAARVALRWGRAMHEARLHLAYTLSDDGCLALKVANIPLRSVWEVTMQLELVVEDAREVPWPRASCVRVARVVSDVRVPDAEVRALLQPLPRDWGHAPRAVWKIFRYLKNKSREDDLLGL